MKCSQFEKWEVGEISESDFQEHMKTCSFCQNLMKQDNWLMSLARSSKKIVEAPGLWNRIESDLNAEKIKSNISERRFQFPAKTILRIAAIVVFAVASTYIFIPRNKIDGTNLLAETALKKVEKKETAYIKAIEKLEKNIQPKLVKLDLELNLLYRDRLETIDAQIEQCREALLVNPANAHVRRYMMAALQDKKETLKEVMKS